MSENQTQKDLRLSVADGVAYSAMVGTGETFLPAFALAIGMNQVIAGLVSTIPLVTGGILQLVAPMGVMWLKSYKRWVVLCAGIQSLCFLPLILGALTGSIPTILVFMVGGIYWGCGLAGGAAWNCWMEELIPQEVRPKFLANRNRFIQFTTLCGFVAGGHLLWHAKRHDHELLAFSGLFTVAMFSRLLSTFLLSKQREPKTDFSKIRMVPTTEIFKRLRAGDQGVFLLFMVCMQFMVHTSAPYFSPYMLRQLQMNYLDYILLISVAFIGRVIALPTLGAFSHRVGATKLLWITSLGIAPLSVAWVFSSNILYLAILQVFSGAIWAGFELAGLLLIFEHIKPHERTSILTVYNLAHTSAVVLGSLVGGATLEAFGESMLGFHVVFTLSSLLRLTPLLILYRTHPSALKIRPLNLRTIGLRVNLGALVQPLLEDIIPKKHSKKLSLEKERHHATPTEHIKVETDKKRKSDRNS